MRTISTERPTEQVTFRRFGDMAEMMLIESIPDEPKEDGQWEYDMYFLQYEYRDGLEEAVDQDIAGWIEMAKAQEPQNVMHVAPQEDQPDPIETAIMETKWWVVDELDKGVEFNGKIYTCTLEKQNLLSAQLGLYAMNTAAGLPANLSWNAKGEPCEEWTLEDLLALSNTISAHVAPIVKAQQEAEIAIKAATSQEEINAIVAGLGVKHDLQADGEASDPLGNHGDAVSGD